MRGVTKSVSRPGSKGGAHAQRQKESQVSRCSRNHGLLRGPQFDQAHSPTIAEASIDEAVPVAVIDGPYDASVLSSVLAQAPINLGNSSCTINSSSACAHGTFVMGILGARRDALIPGLCPDSRLLHIPLFVNEEAPWASVVGLAQAITLAVAAGARLINLSLAILGDETQNHRELAAALDLAEANGALLVVAAGNQGRLAMGQLLSHPATIPVVAVNAAQKLLPDCNFGPSIIRKGVAAFSSEVQGYSPGGGTAVMSGTSAGTAVATGTLAQLWSLRPCTKAAEIRAAIACLGPRNRLMPPLLDRDAFLGALGKVLDATVSSASYGRHDKVSHAHLQGEMAMMEENGPLMSPCGGFGQARASDQRVIPARGAGECSCGARGICSCKQVDSSGSRFVYVLGSVDIRFPDQSVSEQLLAVARKKKIVQGDKEQMRTWYFRVLSEPEARYVARQVCWILTVEGHPAYYLVLRDLHDLADLIRCLGSDADDLSLFVGSSSMVPLDICPGATAPVLAVDQVSSFTKERFVAWIKPSSKIALGPPTKMKTAKSLPSDPGELFAKLVQTADNFGDTDEARALNYLAVNYEPLYEQHATMAKNGWSLDSVKVMSSRLRRDKHIVDPVFAFRQMNTGVVQKYFVRVDVTHLFPMLVNQIAEYFDR